MVLSSRIATFGSTELAHLQTVACTGALQHQQQLLRWNPTRLRQPGVVMKKGVHPALQWIRIVSPHGRLIRVLAAKAFKLDRPTHVRDPGKQSETIGTLAKFRRRFEFAPKAAAPASSDSSASPSS